MLIIMLFSATLLLAYSNGANDNFKGVATLYGSRTLNYHQSLWLASASTLAGSLCSLLLASSLVTHFSGKGLVPVEVAQQSQFLLAVGLGAALTVLLATRLGFPISTTHSLIGAMLGAGWMAASGELNSERLSNIFLLPLLLSPLVALVLGGGVYLGFNKLKRSLGLESTSCFCIGQQPGLVAITHQSPQRQQPQFQEQSLAGSFTATLGDSTRCQRQYGGRLLELPLKRLLDTGHIISAGLVCFARGLNDTPKIVGLIFAANLLEIKWSLMAVAAAMILGGLLNARRVAETLSHRITDLSHGQGFSANLVTALLVIFASKLGLPVSTTHVSVGSIIGIGCITGRARFAMIATILLSWVITLPVAMALGAGLYLLVV
jgi:PiT family inorganic phosphate transporter